MKLRSLLCSLLAAAPAVLSAQNVSYSLPMTTVTVEVDAVQESFFAGPYASFAKELLGLDVRQRNEVRTVLKEIRLVTRAEADPSARYSVDYKAAGDRFLALSSQGLVSFRDNSEAGEITWRFNPQAIADFETKGLTSSTRTEIRTTWQEVRTDTSFTRVPVQESVEVEKTPEMKAREAAEMVLNAREERFNIATGNTDATFSGEALGAALAELERTEQEYLSLFVGITVSRPQHGSFDVIPSASAKKQQYVAFRLSDQDGVVSDGIAPGTPYYLEFEPVPVEGDGLDDKGGKGYIHYRIPAVCNVRLTSGGTPLFQTRIPVSQLGRVAAIPIR